VSNTPSAASAVYLYRVRNWDTQYENNITRKIKSLNWVATPNKHDGRGFRRLMRMKDGIVLYGAWHLILQVASKMPERGILRDTDGALSAQDIADKTGAPPEVIARALEACSTPEIAWLERENLPTYRDPVPQSPDVPGESPDDTGRSPDTPGSGPGVPGSGHDIPGVIEGRKEGKEGTEQKGREGRKEGNAPLPPLTAEEFAQPDPFQLGQRLVDCLMPNHWKPGDTRTAINSAARILATSVNPAIEIQSICEKHATHAQWHADNPKAYKKSLAFWFSDGDYLHPAARSGKKESQTGW